MGFRSRSVRLCWPTWLEKSRTRRDYGEPRMKAYGEVEGVWFCCVYTLRSDVHRLISVHRVRAREVRRWLENT